MIALSAGLSLVGVIVGSTSLPSPGLHDWLVAGAIWSLPPLVHLTFDDGPDPDRTPRVLDALAEFQIRATFFCIGRRVARAPEIVRRIDAEGHRIGSHGWHHTSLAFCSRRKIREHLRRCEGTVGDATGGFPTLARPPYGRRDYRFYEEAQQLAMTPMFWSLDSGDWLGIDSTRLADRVCRAKSGDIVLLQDGNPRARGLLGALAPILRAHRTRFPAVHDLEARA
jgi:peptidoglycan/xylan/chitin deacetylase (PgdA/CDA1 family)